MKRGRNRRRRNKQRFRRWSVRDYKVIRKSPRSDMSLSFMASWSTVAVLGAVTAYEVNMRKSESRISQLDGGRRHSG